MGLNKFEKKIDKRKRIDAAEWQCSNSVQIKKYKSAPCPLKIFILGYYNHQNFGDDLFQQAFSKLLHANRDQLFFLSLDRLGDNDVQQIASMADLVIFGGGDLINEYFIDRLASIYNQISHVPILAIGVGFPSVDQVYEKNLHMFNFIYSRTFSKEVQLACCRIAIHKKIIFGPDLVFALYKECKENNMNIVEMNKIAIAPSMDQIPQSTLSGLREWLARDTNSIVDTFILDLELDNDSKNRAPRTRYLSIPPQTCDTLSTVFDSYRLLVTFKFHALVLAIFAKCPVLVNKYSFKCVDLVKRVFGQQHSPALIFDGVPMIGNLVYIDEHRQELIECMHRYLQWTRDFFSWFDLCKLCVGHVHDTISYGFMNKSNAHDKVACEPQNYQLNVNEISNNAPYHYGLKTKKFRVTRDDHMWLVQDLHQKNRLDRPFVLYPDHRFAGSTHRYGWNWTIANVESLHNRYTNCGIQLDTFLDASVDLELCRDPYFYPWIGFVHHPLNLDPRYSTNCFANLIKSKFYRLSEPYCLGLITLSNHLKKCLSPVVSVPRIDVLTHPMPSPADQWTIAKWYAYSNICQGKRPIVSVGNWLRNVFSIYTLSYPNKCVVVAANILPPEEYFVYDYDAQIDPPLQIDCCDNSSAAAGSCPTISDNKWIYFANCYLADKSCFVTESEQLGRPLNNIYQNQLETWASTVKPIGPLDSDTYDVMLASSVVFLNLVDCSASNSVIECIMYNTPIIINRHPATIEYLGDMYPLFYDTLDEAQLLMTDRNTIFNAYLYLQDMDKTRFTSDMFTSQLRNIGASYFK